MGVIRLPLLLLCCNVPAAAEEPDSTATLLDEIVVDGNAGSPVRVSGDGNLRVSAGALLRGSRVMGEADMLASLKKVGGVSAIGDYGSGLVIQGNDPSQAIYRIDGAPVFFPYRFGGVFSTFNTTHFSALSVMRNNRGGEAPSRLGAVVDLTPSLDYGNPLSASVNVGLLASTLTVKTGVRERFAITASGRVSYIDQVYGRFLNNDHNTMRYRFADVNISAGWRIDSLNTITGNYFYNSDRLLAGNANYAMDTRLNWFNNVGALAWKHAGMHAAEIDAYYSEFRSRLTVGMPQFDVLGTAGIRSAGLTGKVKVTAGSGFRPEVTVGGEAVGYKITPLWARLVGDVTQLTAPAASRTTGELRLFADARFRPIRSLSFAVGLSASTYGFEFYSADPRVSVEWRHRGNTFTFGAGRFSQYLHLVGFSEIGLASNFWYGSDSAVRPQRSVDFTAGWSRGFLNDELTVAVSAYYKIVKSQSEYFGQVLDIINYDYVAAANIRCADGYNAGFDVAVQKRFGNLTGAVSYAFGSAMRRDGSDGEWFHSLTDTGHQFKADAEYAINRHWSVSAAFVYASGRVYTPTRYLYLIANRLIADYADRNSGRMPDYQRLDLSGTYRFRTGGRFPLNHTVNISLINAYGHRNIESQYFAIDGETLRYKLYRVASLYRFLPSISYSIDF